MSRFVEAVMRDRDCDICDPSLMLMVYGGPV
jgi:hypothetical protein